MPLMPPLATGLRNQGYKVAYLTKHRHKFNIHRLHTHMHLTKQRNFIVCKQILQHRANYIQFNCISSKVAVLQLTTYIQLVTHQLYSYTIILQNS